MLVVRNDDASWYHNLDELKCFCDICDKHSVKIIQAITLMGQLHGYPKIRTFDSSFTNEQINEYCGDDLPSAEFLDYILSRNDIIAIHGLHHNHRNSEEELLKAKDLLTQLGLEPTYLVAPFNELPDGITDGDEYLGLKVSGKCCWLEGILNGGPLTSDIAYCHAWRFTTGNDFNYSYDQLDKCLQRLTTTA